MRSKGRPTISSDHLIGEDLDEIQAVKLAQERQRQQKEEEWQSMIDGVERKYYWSDFYKTTYLEAVVSSETRMRVLESMLHRHGASFIFDDGCKLDLSRYRSDVDRSVDVGIHGDNWDKHAAFVKELEEYFETYCRDLLKEILEYLNDNVHTASAHTLFSDRNIFLNGNRLKLDMSQKGSSSFISKILDYNSTSRKDDRGDEFVCDHVYETCDSINRKVELAYLNCLKTSEMGAQQ